MKNRVLVAWIVAGIVLAAAVPFLRCLYYGIVSIDDYQYVILYQPVREWMGWDSIVHAFTNVEQAIWMPLTWLSYSADWALFGDWFGGFHLHAIAVHAVNAVLVWCFLRIVFTPYADERRGVPFDILALLGALVWAVHPLRCESVVFIASRKDVLSFFWELLALIFWAQGSLSRQKRHTAWSVFFFVLGSMCKPSVMTFPVLCFLIDAFVFREVRLFRYVVPVLYMLFLGAFAGWQQAAGGAMNDVFHQPLWSRLLGACAAFGIYLRNFVWPQWLAMQCIKTWPRLPRFWLPGLLLSGLWGWFLLKRALAYWDNRAETIRVERCGETPSRLTGAFAADYLFVGMSWFAIAVAPMLGVAHFGYHSFADRFTYIPALGLSVLFVFGLARIWERRGRVFALVPAIAVVLAFACCTWRQTGFWKDDLTLFSHTLEVDGNQNTYAHRMVGDWYFEYPHDLEKCVAEYEIAASQNFKYVYPYTWIYVFALGELGRESQIREVIGRYEAETLQMYGPERTQAIFAGADGLSAAERASWSTYCACKVAWWLAGDGNLKGVKEVFDRIGGTVLEKDSLWLYLRWRYSLAIGDERESARLYDEFHKASKDSGYAFFRYLFTDGQVEHRR